MSDGLLEIASGLGLAALLGLLSWSFVEYGIHGLLSHRFRTPVSPLHWSHHRTPAAVFTSPLAWVPTGAALFVVGGFIFDAPTSAAFLAGLLAGFLRYEYVHWRIHFRAARTPRQELLRNHHLAHHFVNPKAYHGVTTRLWDHVFGTLPEHREADYQRAAATPPIPGPSNLGASWNPAAVARVVATAFQRDQP
jgi:dihydroceramide fatty acyl 2-hydroxylase